MNYLYHYHAIYQPEAGATGHIDGTTLKAAPFQSHEDFTLFRESVAKTNGIEPGKLTICSITLISGNQD